MLRVGETGIEEKEEEITCRIYLTSELSRFNYGFSHIFLILHIIALRYQDILLPEQSKLQESRLLYFPLCGL
jgi:hypothetical protein